MTGYGYEPWHIRYVGAEHALRIRELNIPFEEYIEALRRLNEEKLFDEESE